MKIQANRYYMLRNGLTAFVGFIVPHPTQLKQPVQGYYADADGAYWHESWREDGLYRVEGDFESGYDIVYECDKQPGDVDRPTDRQENQGLTSLRDEFAGRAMLAEISHQGLEGRDTEHIAGMAYEMADAMLAMRDKQYEAEYVPPKQVSPEAVEFVSPSDDTYYGYCPQCGAAGKTRERRPNGNDTCTNGHTYPSADASPF